MPSGSSIPSSPRTSAIPGRLSSSRSPATPPSITTCATWMACRADRFGDARDLLDGAARDEDVVAFACEAAADGAADSALGADTDDDCGWRTHHESPAANGISWQSTRLKSGCRAAYRGQAG